LLDPAPLLVRLVRQARLAEATRRARQAVRSQTRALAHGDVLAQLSLGTWRFLLPDADPGHKYLWSNALNRAFPHLGISEHQLVTAVDGVYRLRNRCAHMDSLLNSANVRAQYSSRRTVLAAIDPHAEQWFVTTQRVTTLLRTRP